MLQQEFWLKLKHSSKDSLNLNVYSRLQNKAYSIIVIENYGLRIYHSLL